MAIEVPKQVGRIEVAVGCMYSGKTEWLQSQLRPHSVAGNKILTIHYMDDTRYGQGHIYTHYKAGFEAKPARTVEDIEHYIDQDGVPEVLGVDEIQFFEAMRFVKLVEQLREERVFSYLSGLDLDFAARPWETTMKVMATADWVQKKNAVCSICKVINAATRTQRLINGKPATLDSPRVLIGGKESYEARCLKDYQPPQ